MSWSVSACGPVPKVVEQLEQQFSAIKLSDEGEQQTVQNVRLVVSQTLATIDSEKVMRITASGSMNWKSWNPKSGPYQSVDLKIEPINFTV